MLQAVRDEWVQALRSGEYQQGQGALCLAGWGGDQFCCLGVLIDITDRTAWSADEQAYINGKDRLVRGCKLKSEGCDIYFLSEEFKQKVDLSEEEELTLSRMNDDGKTFEEIANWIENHVLVNG